MDKEMRMARLEPPRAPVRMVLDTDTYNEIDDPFALVYALLSPELDVQAVYAAPFRNERAATPGDGMQKSFEEILRLLECLDRSPDNFVFRGAERFLKSEREPSPGDAAQDLVRRAMKDVERPLYVAAIGAITNIASALLMEPEIIDRLVIVWLGGQPLYWPDTRVFNVEQDVTAARVVLDSGVPLIHIPCCGVASHLLTTRSELREYIAGRNRIGDYLYRMFYMYHPGTEPWAKEIWDVAAIAWLVNADWVPTQLVPSPILTDEIAWLLDPRRHLIRNATFVRRNPIFRDMFCKISGYPI